MDKQPKISIIIPVYNAQNYIAKCLDSLINQTYKNLEIICVDDCSKDDSLKILRQYEQSDNRIIVLHNESNKGPATARNMALERMTGEYLMFCDNDDTYTPQMCEKMLDALLVNNVDLAFCKSNFVYESDYRPFDRIEEYINAMPTGFIDFSKMDKGIVNVVLWNKIFKAEILKKYNIKFPDGITHEDDAFVFMYVSVINSAFCIETKLYNYLLRDTSYRATSFFYKAKQKIRFDALRSLQYVYIFMKKNGIWSFSKSYFLHCENNELGAFVNYLKPRDVGMAKRMVNELVAQDKLPQSSLNLFLHLLEKRQFLKPHQYIFSVRNIENHKQLVICGLKFKFRRRNKCK